MGNRAIVKPVGKNIGVYLHWNGGRDSVEAFLTYCKLKGFRSFDDSYGLARFCQVVGNYFGGSLSMGIMTDVYMTEDDASGLDNGIYEVKDWEIVGRRGAPHFEQNEYKLVDMLVEIDKCQPKNERLGKGYLTAKLVLADELNIGDFVYIDGMEGEVPKVYEIVGFGAPGQIVNGRNVEGVPYVEKYGRGDGRFDLNINNYLQYKNWHGDVVWYRKARKSKKRQMQAGGN